MSNEKIIIPFKHGFKIHVPNFLDEWFNNGTENRCKGALHVPFNIFNKYLVSIVERCIEINDPVLNRYMVEMALYSVGDPESKDYDQNAIDETIRIGREYEEKQTKTNNYESKS